MVLELRREIGAEDRNLQVLCIQVEAKGMGLKESLRMEGRKQRGIGGWNAGSNANRLYSIL